MPLSPDPGLAAATLHAARDEIFMRQALALARETAALASPNPQVGCVLVRSSPDPAQPGQVLGEGAHRYADLDHAEIVALKQAAAAGRSVAGATAYVTLEPCAHHGRTGPCAEALVRARIARCVIATTDPNPLVSGKGLALLRGAGVEVAVGVCQTQARELNLAFAHFIQHRRPFVTLKAAISVDGSLAPPAHARAGAAPHWLTGPLAREKVQRLRHGSDAILTGIGTVLADDPALTDRTGLPRRRPLLRVILDPRLRTPLDSALLRTARENSFPEPDLLLVHAEDPALAAPERKQALETAAPGRIELRSVPASPAGRLSLPAVLALLAERQCLSLLIEAGSALNAAFLHEDLVDRVALFFAPLELAHGAIPFAAGGPSPYLLQQRLQQTTTRELGPDVLVTGLLHDPWPTHP